MTQSSSAKIKWLVRWLDLDEETLFLPQKGNIRHYDYWKIFYFTIF